MVAALALHTSGAVVAEDTAGDGALTKGAGSTGEVVAAETDRAPCTVVALVATGQCGAGATVSEGACGGEVVASIAQSASAGVVAK